jgi:hypothetical protein
VRISWSFTPTRLAARSILEPSPLSMARSMELHEWRASVVSDCSASALRHAAHFIR